jgi:hypothetical protein
MPLTMRATGLGSGIERPLSCVKTPRGRFYVSRTSQAFLYFAHFSAKFLLIQLSVSLPRNQIAT